MILIRPSVDMCEMSILLFSSCLKGYPRKAGQFSVGQVLYGTEFSHEFSHSTEDRPTWDFGRKAVCFSTFFTTTPRPVFATSRLKPAYPRVVCIVSSRRWSAGTSIQSPGCGKRWKVAVGLSVWW